MKAIFVLFLGFTFSIQLIANPTLEQFKDKLDHYVSKVKYDWSAQMPISKVGQTVEMPQPSINLFMTDPVTKLQYYPQKQVIVDMENGYIYDLKKNMIYEASSKRSYAGEGFSEEFYRGRDILLKE